MKPRVAASLAVVLAGGLLAGCAHTPGLSNGSVSACYRAIPKAIVVSGDKNAHLVGVHRIPADHVKANLPTEAQQTLSGDDDATVCAVVLKGTFDPGQVQAAPSGEGGDYALILLTSRHLDLLASFVLDHVPTSLGKRVI